VVGGTPASPGPEPKFELPPPPHPDAPVITNTRDEIDRVAGAIKATHPDFRYQPIAEPEELGNGGRIQWVSGRPGEAPAYAGTDFIIARDGRIAALYLFFDKLP
jgi:hypothetical protein